MIPGCTGGCDLSNCSDGSKRGISNLSRIGFRNWKVQDGSLPVFCTLLGINLSGKAAQIVQKTDSRGLKPPIVPATVEFLDIAGLIAGAHKGEGLGNKFLSHIREVTAICHVVRAFSDPDVIKKGVVDPKSDFETVKTELGSCEFLDSRIPAASPSIGTNRKLQNEDFLLILCQRG